MQHKRNPNSSLFQQNSVVSSALLLFPISLKTFSFSVQIHSLCNLANESASILFRQYFLDQNSLLCKNISPQDTPGSLMNHFKSVLYFLLILLLTISTNVLLCFVVVHTRNRSKIRPFSPSCLQCYSIRPCLIFDPQMPPPCTPSFL